MPSSCSTTCAMADLTDQPIQFAGVSAISVIDSDGGGSCLTGLRKRAISIAMTFESDRYCPFCALKADRVVFENEFALAISDGFPVSPGHMLILTRRHFGSIFESSEEEQRDLLSLLWRAKAHLDQRFRPDGYNVGINDGIPAGQTVPHLHIFT